MAGGFRKNLTKEVTKTTVKIATIVTVNGVPTMETLPDEVLIGNVSLENAQKQLNKKHGKQVTVFELKANTETYEMSVEEFLKHATLKVAEVEQTPAV